MARKAVGRKGPGIISGTEKQVREMAVGYWERIQHLPRSAAVMLGSWMRSEDREARERGQHFWLKQLRWMVDLFLRGATK